MLGRERIEEIFSDYVSIEYDVRCIIKTLVVYEEFCVDNGKSDMKDAIHTIKNLLEKVQNEFSENNDKFDRELITA